MASTPEAAELTEGHRLAQARLGAQVVEQIIATWAVLDPEALDRTVAAWLSVALPIIRQHRASSAALAGRYLSTYRTLELGSAAQPFTPILATVLDTPAAATSLTVTGPARIKAATARGVPLDQAVAKAKVSVSKTAMRHALDGGNTTLIRSVEADQQALGWARATSGKPCAFCAMLASRGGVYRSEATARGGRAASARVGGRPNLAKFEVHDGCNCKPEPIYSSDSRLPRGSERWADLWAEHAHPQHPGDSQLNAFRRALSAE